MKKQMKQILYAASLVAFAFTAGVFAQNKSAPVKYDTYDKYFERNDSGLEGDTSFLAFRTQNQFDRIFGTAPIPDKNKSLPENAFDTMIVVATITRSYSYRDYTVKKVSREKDKLIVAYDTKDQPPSSNSWSVPLIISVDKSKYKTVVFRENWGKPGQKSVTVKIK